MERRKITIFYHDRCSVIEKTEDIKSEISVNDTITIEGENYSITNIDRHFNLDTNIEYCICRIEQSGGLISAWLNELTV